MEVTEKNLLLQRAQSFRIIMKEAQHEPSRQQLR